MTDYDTNGGRTHEPSLRELTAELDGLRVLMEERNKWYGERDKDRQVAVDKALAAVEKQTAAAFEAAKEAATFTASAQKEAIAKEEDKQRAYNASHNDLLKKLDDQNKSTIPRTECETRLQQLEEKISLVRDAVSAIVNRGLGYEKVWGWIVAAAGSGGVLAWIAAHYAK